MLSFTDDAPTSKFSIVGFAVAIILSVGILPVALGAIQQSVEWSEITLGFNEPRQPNANADVMVLATVWIRAEGGEAGQVQVEIASNVDDLNYSPADKGFAYLGQGGNTLSEPTVSEQMLTFVVPAGQYYRLNDVVIAGNPEFAIAELWERPA